MTDSRVFYVTPSVFDAHWSQQRVIIHPAMTHKLRITNKEFKKESRSQDLLKNILG